MRSRGACAPAWRSTRSVSRIGPGWSRSIRSCTRTVVARPCESGSKHAAEARHPAENQPQGSCRDGAAAEAFFATIKAEIGMRDGMTAPAPDVEGGDRTCRLQNASDAAPDLRGKARIAVITLCGTWSRNSRTTGRHAAPCNWPGGARPSRRTSVRRDSVRGYPEPEADSRARWASVGVGRWVGGRRRSRRVRSRTLPKI